jgi:ubiquinone biosynthesis monooxygenase Coq7
MTLRHYSLFDKICIEFDKGLKTLNGVITTTGRENPAKDAVIELSETPLSPTEKQHAAGLMRVNHTGEICAQALYQGQALTAKLPDIREKLQHAAQEENDHLAWCQNRLNELQSHTSYLNPFWYFGSYLMGAVAGLIGDNISLGFLAETEQQVVNHLQSHLKLLPENDLKSRAIVTQMELDEAKHGDMAIEHGAATLPDWVKTCMHYQSKVMTTVAYWL